MNKKIKLVKSGKTWIEGQAIEQLGKFKVDKVIRRLCGLGSLDDIDITDRLAGCDLPYQGKLGTIGGGNHFAELQSIAKVYAKHQDSKYDCSRFPSVD